MTVVAAIARGGVVTMAADTATNYAGTTVHGARKIHRHRLTGGEDALFAWSGNGALVPVVARHLKLEAPGEDEWLDDWANAVAGAVTEIAAEATPPLVESSEGTTTMDGAGLLGYTHGGQARLWYLFTHQAVPVAPLSPTPSSQVAVAALGSGCDAALGALHTEVRLSAHGMHLHPERACVEAVRLACTLAPGCYLTGAGPLVETVGGPT